MKVYAPGKIILSGEHAVVHGGSALAMAVNRYAKAEVTQDMKSRVSFDLSDLAYKSHLTFDGLQRLKSRIKRKYHKFLNGEYSIRDVLAKPFELAQMAVGVFAESNHVTLPHGVKVHVASDIPMSCGMGSSAATIIAVMYATSHYLNIKLTNQQLYDAALQTENMQHGQSSGFDLRLVLDGGCLYRCGDVIEKRPAPLLPIFLVNTGTPIVTTGECVSHARPFFEDKTLLLRFAAVTSEMDEALQSNHLERFKSTISENHRLLQIIEVVPKRVADFIYQVETMNGAAKICGAGAIKGDAAGMVMVVMYNESELKKLCREYHYELLTVQCESRGVHVV